MSTIERIRSSFARQGLMQHLGATLTRIEPGAVSMHLASRQNSPNSTGTSMRVRSAQSRTPPAATPHSP